jgi:hypothetical protein
VREEFCGLRTLVADWSRYSTQAPHPNRLGVIRRRCRSDRQTSQQDVPEGLGVAHPIPSDFDQLAPEYGLQAFVEVKVSGRNLIFNR